MPVKLPTIEELFHAGVHFGHLRARSHPKSKDYVYATLNKVMVINLERTREQLKKAIDYFNQAIKEGKTILWVGTKTPVKEPIKKIAEQSKGFYINHHWLNGFLTNYDVFKQNLQQLNEMIEQKDNEYYLNLTKKEKLAFDKKLDQLNKKYGGIRQLNKLPDVIVIVDPNKEKNAVAEAAVANIPIIAIGDTNSNPNDFDIFVPANDEGKNSLEMILKTLAENLIKI